MNICKYKYVYQFIRKILDFFSFYELFVLYKYTLHFNKFFLSCYFVKTRSFKEIKGLKEICLSSYVFILMCICCPYIKALENNDSKY